MSRLGRTPLTPPVGGSDSERHAQTWSRWDTTTRECCSFLQQQVCSSCSVSLILPLLKRSNEPLCRGFGQQRHLAAGPTTTGSSLLVWQHFQHFSLSHDPSTTKCYRPYINHLGLWVEAASRLASCHGHIINKLQEHMTGRIFL